MGNLARLNTVFPIFLQFRQKPAGILGLCVAKVKQYPTRHMAFWTKPDAELQWEVYRT